MSAETKLSAYQGKSNDATTIEKQREATRARAATFKRMLLSRAEGKFLQVSPISKLKMLKPEKKKPDSLTLHQVGRIIANLDGRDKAFFVIIKDSEDRIIPLTKECIKAYKGTSNQSSAVTGKTWDRFVQVVKDVLRADSPEYNKAAVTAAGAALKAGVDELVVEIQRERRV